LKTIKSQQEILSWNKHLSTAKKVTGMETFLLITVKCHVSSVEMVTIHGFLSIIPNSETVN